jgi:hypothetical protein
MLQELSARPPTSPATGVAGRACRLAGTHTLPGSHPIPKPVPSWASVVGDGVRANLTAVSRQDFLAVYERFADSNLRTRLILRHQASSHEITVSCLLSAPPFDANAPSDVRCCHHKCKCAPAAQLQALCHRLIME